MDAPIRDWGASGPPPSVPRVFNPDPDRNYVLVALVHGKDRKKAFIRVEYILPWDRKAVLASQQTHRMFVVNEAQRLQFEVKHSASWKCFQCGDAAHDITCSPLSYLTEPYPHMLINFCAACGNGSTCEEAIAGFNDEMGKEMGIVHQSTVRKREGPSGNPLAASCATCHIPGKKLRRCMACKVIRYCGGECQRKDWARHKNICKKIVSVEVEPWVKDVND